MKRELIAFDKSDKIVRLSKVNSIDFLRQAFGLYQSEIPFVIDGGTGPNLEVLGCRFECCTPEPGGGWLKLPAVNNRSDKPAQIIFTSGTEGLPKAIVLSYKALANVVDRLNKVMAVDDSIREYIGVPVTFSFGLGRARAVMAAGGEIYLPENGFDVREIVSMLQAGEINAISAVPTLWRILLENRNLFADVGHRVRWIEIGSQYMSGEEKAALKELFPKANIVQHYGLTEASRSTFLEISSCTESQLDSVGMVRDGVDVEISKTGRILIRGDHLASAVLRDGKLEPITDEDGWLETSDEGRLVGNTLFYLGRADDVINCSGVKISPELLQTQIKKHSDFPGELVVCGVPDDLRGQAIMVAVTKSLGSIEHLAGIAAACLKELGLDAADAIHIVKVKTIPKTPTGKVKRKELAQQYQPKKNKAAGGTGVRGVFSDYFGDKVSSQATFKTLGGDSLRYVQLSARLESFIGYPPPGWENLTVAELEKLQRAPETTHKSSRFKKMDVTIFLRAVAIIAVVLIHAGVSWLAGATTLLFLLVGYNFARFQSDALIEGNGWPAILRFLGIILIPYYLFAALFWLVDGTINVPLLLLYENFTGNKETLIFPFWFVQQLVQCFLVLGVLLSLPISRKWLKQNIHTVSLLGSGVLVVIALVFERFVNGNGAYDGWPIAFYLPVFALGWALFFARNLRQKLLVCFFALLLAAEVIGFHGFSYWLLFGCFGLTFCASISVTPLLRQFIECIAASTIYLFVSNGLVIYVLLFKLGIGQPLLLTALALLVGVVAWRLNENLRLANVWPSKVLMPLPFKTIIPKHFVIQSRGVSKHG